MPDIANLLPLARLLGVTVDGLLSGEEQTPTPPVEKHVHIHVGGDEADRDEEDGVVARDE